MKEKLIALKVSKKLENEILKTQMEINDVQMLKSKITKQDIKYVQNLMRDHKNKEMNYIG